MTNAQIVPLLVIPWLIWRYYLRFRKSVGRQIFRFNRTVTFVVSIFLLICLVGFSAVHRSDLLIGLASGLTLGTIIGYCGLKLTVFEISTSGNFYTPNPYLGVGVSLLLVGRLVYRFFVIYSVSGLAPGIRPDLAQSPVTLGIFGLTFGYYIAYSVGLLLHFKKDVNVQSV